MHVPIPIPIGAKHVAVVRGAVWKFVSCKRCENRYAYLLELEATGQDHDLLFLDGTGSAERARAQAEQNLLQKSRNCVLPVPCPNCGFYQAEMSRQLKDDVSINAIQIAGVAIALFALVPLAFNVAYNWVAAVVLAVMGFAVVAYGYVVAFRFEPNSGDPEPRKLLGRKHAVWGDQLAEIVAMSPPGESDIAPNGG